MAAVPEGPAAMEAELVAGGKFARIVSRRPDGTPRSVTVGFVSETDGSVLVAAGSPDAAWAEDLIGEPRAQLAIAGDAWPVDAELLDRPEAGRAIRELILRYGTPAESLGAGPAFRLRRADAC